MCLECVLEHFQVKVRSEYFGDFGVIWGAKLHRYVTCLNMDGGLHTVRLNSFLDTEYIFELSFQFYRFEVHLTIRFKFILDLLESGLPDSQEKTVEDIKECRLLLILWCQTTLMPEEESNLFYDQFRPKSHPWHKSPRFASNMIKHNWPSFSLILENTLLFEDSIKRRIRSFAHTRTSYNKRNWSTFQITAFLASKTINMRQRFTMQNSFNSFFG